MPKRDKTGPLGQGPITGRGLGPCGSGMRQGFGIGFGRRVTLTKAEEIRILKAELKEIEKRLKELK